MRKFILIGFLLLNLSSAADTLKLGQYISPFKLANQHGKLITVGNKAKIIFFTKEKTPSILLNTFLASKDKKFLSNNEAFYIADISGMPFLVTKLIALPKMKKSPYDILLAKKEATLAFVPHKTGHITIIKQSEGKIESIAFVNKMSTLKNIFK